MTPVFLLLSHDLDGLDAHRTPGRDNCRRKGREDEDNWCDSKYARVVNRDAVSFIPALKDCSQHELFKLSDGWLICHLSYMVDQMRAMSNKMPQAFRRVGVEVPDRDESIFYNTAPSSCATISARRKRER